MIKHQDGFATELEPERYELFEPPRYRFEVSRRTFLAALGGGVLVVAALPPAQGQRRGTSARGTIDARLHIGSAGAITVLTSKVEVGQGSRTQITQAAAEELKVSPDQIALVMADTDIVPNDGGTYGSRTTPATIPDVRRAAAAAREALVAFACAEWGVDPSGARVKNGEIQHGSRRISYAELAQKATNSDLFDKEVPGDVALTPVEEWQVLGRGILKPAAADVATGAHEYPSDIRRPGMLYGKVLRPPALTASLIRVDLAPARAMDGVTVVRDGEFVGCAAPTTHQARKAIAAIAETAEWGTAPHPGSDELYRVLRESLDRDRRGWRGARTREEGNPDNALQNAATTLEATYRIPYIQHVPMEPRAAVAQWDGDKLTVWTGTQRPNGVRGELARAFSISIDDVRVVVPDTGGGFGGKHTGETATEAARLAKAAGKPVSLQWTREEEFMWAYFRPAGVMDVRAGLDDSGRITAWEFTNFNSGGSGLQTPYTVPHTRHRFLPSDSPLREGSYRALASTANHFARESAMDELAEAAGADPLEFRLRQLQRGRLYDVLKKAAEEFGWQGAVKDGRGIGLACGTEKGSYVAACAEVSVRPEDGKVLVHRICQAYECGAIQNPTNLRAQVHGCMIMGLGAALMEHIEFADGKILNGALEHYDVPRFQDVPPLDIHLLNRTDLDSAGAGETPIIAVAPAIANAVYDATGQRLRDLPLRPKPA